MAMQQVEVDIADLPLRRYEDAAGPVAVRRVSWGAAVAGAAIGMVFQIWLSMLGVAIGASTIDPLKEQNPMNGLGIGSLIWLALSVVIASYIGGWATGRLAGIPRRTESALHGALSWAVSNVAAFLMIGTIFGALISGTTNLARGTLSAAGQAVSGAAEGQPNVVDRTVDETREGIDTLTRQAQEARRSGQLQQEARQAGDRAAEATAGTSWGLVILMLLGLGAGIGGAISGAPLLNVYNRKHRS